MRRTIQVLINVFAIAGFLLSAAYAINIKNATIKGTSVFVEGAKAVTSAAITWEGQTVTTANKQGDFKFTTAVVPQDCVGALSDGVSNINVSISGCTPQQSGGGGALVIKDSLGQVVGRWMDNQIILRQVGADRLAFFVIPAGFGKGSIQFFYTSLGCTGTRYMGSIRALNSFVENVNTTDGQTGYFASWPAQELTIQSYEIFNTDENPSGTGACTDATPFTTQVGQPLTVDLLLLGTPPFHLE